MGLAYRPSSQEQEDSERPGLSVPASRSPLPGTASISLVGGLGASPHTAPQSRHRAGQLLHPAPPSGQASPARRWGRKARLTRQSPRALSALFSSALKIRQNKPNPFLSLLLSSETDTPTLILGSDSKQLDSCCHPGTPAPSCINAGVRPGQVPAPRSPDHSAEVTTEPRWQGGCGGPA